eukprot:6209263-Prymnesium_polylepis.1
MAVRFKDSFFVFGTLPPNHYTNGTASTSAVNASVSRAISAGFIPSSAMLVASTSRPMLRSSS